MLDPESVIADIRLVTWFSNVGKSDPIDSPFDVIHVVSWAQAIKLRSTPEAADAFSEGAGMLSRELSSRFRADYRNWNRVARMVRELLETEILPQVDLIITDSVGLTAIDEDGELVKRSVRWDLAHYAMEYAYSELVAPRFYTHVFEIYRLGHFPCHWNEQSPMGQLWVL